MLSRQHFMSVYKVMFYVFVFMLKKTGRDKEKPKKSKTKRKGHRLCYTSSKIFDGFHSCNAIYLSFSEMDFNVLK